jgi:hypothetical protein
MSEWKRSHQEYATPAAPLNPVARGPVRPVAVRSELGIDESQPRPTLEMARAMAMLTEGGDEAGGDPYNAVGRHIGARQAG